MYSAVDADYSVALGYNALAEAEGDYNIGIGQGAGQTIDSGTYNVCMGSQAGDSITSGTHNTCIGTSSDAAAAVNNQLAVGYAATVTGQYGIAIGNQVVAATNDFSFGKLSNVVTNDFDADADWSRSSDVRLKRNIEDTTLGLAFINDIRPVKFQWKPSNEVPKELTSEYNEENQKNLDYISHGFIAQEIKEVIDRHGDSSFGVWHLDADGETQRIKKNMLVIPLIKAVQQLSAQVTTLTAEVSALKGE
jgi:hypothetical protein